MKLNERQKRILIVSGILLIGAVLYRYSSIFGSLFAFDSEIAVKQRQVEKYLELISQTERLTERIASAKESMEDAESLLLNGDTETLVGVEIQNTVVNIARRAGVEIQRKTPLKNTDKKGAYYNSVSVNFTLSSNLRQIMMILYDLANTQKLLIVEDFTMRVVGNPQNEKITTVFTVTGYHYAK